MSTYVNSNMFGADSILTVKSRIVKTDEVLQCYESKIKSMKEKFKIKQESVQNELVQAKNRLISILDERNQLEKKCQTLEQTIQSGRQKQTEQIKEISQLKETIRAMKLKNSTDVTNLKNQLNEHFHCPERYSQILNAKNELERQVNQLNQEVEKVKRKSGKLTVHNLDVIEIIADEVTCKCGGTKKIRDLDVSIRSGAPKPVRVRKKKTRIKAERAKNDRDVCDILLEMENILPDRFRLVSPVPGTPKREDTFEPLKFENPMPIEETKPPINYARRIDELERKLEQITSLLFRDPNTFDLNAIKCKVSTHEADSTSKHNVENHRKKTRHKYDENVDSSSKLAMEIERIADVHVENDDETRLKIKKKLMTIIPDKTVSVRRINEKVDGCPKPSMDVLSGILNGRMDVIKSPKKKLAKKMELDREKELTGGKMNDRKREKTKMTGNLEKSEITAGNENVNGCSNSSRDGQFDDFEENEMFKSVKSKVSRKIVSDDDEEREINERPNQKLFSKNQPIKNETKKSPKPASEGLNSPLKRKRLKKIDEIHSNIDAIAQTAVDKFNRQTEFPNDLDDDRPLSALITHKRKADSSIEPPTKKPRRSLRKPDEFHGFSNAAVKKSNAIVRKFTRFTEQTRCLSNVTLIDDEMRQLVGAWHESLTGSGQKSLKSCRNVEKSHQTVIDPNDSDSNDGLVMDLSAFVDDSEPIEHVKPRQIEPVEWNEPENVVKWEPFNFYASIETNLSNRPMEVTTIKEPAQNVKKLPRASQIESKRVKRPFADFRPTFKRNVDVKANVDVKSETIRLTNKQMNAFNQTYHAAINAYVQSDNVDVLFDKLASTPALVLASNFAFSLGGDRDFAECLDAKLALAVNHRKLIGAVCYLNDRASPSEHNQLVELTLDRIARNVMDFKRSRTQLDKLIGSFCVLCRVYRLKARVFRFVLEAFYTSDALGVDVVFNLIKFYPGCIADQADIRADPTRTSWLCEYLFGVYLRQSRSTIPEKIARILNIYLSSTKHYTHTDRSRFTQSLLDEFRCNYQSADVYATIVLVARVEPLPFLFEAIVNVLTRDILSGLESTIGGTSSCTGFLFRCLDLLMRIVAPVKFFHEWREKFDEICVFFEDVYGKRDFYPQPVQEKLEEVIVYLIKEESNSIRTTKTKRKKKRKNRNKSNRSKINTKN